jgi:hypothetical protein
MQSLKTGLASPQFHVKHDDLFETTQQKKGGFRMPRSYWMSLSGFAKPEAMVSAANQAEERRSERQQRAGSQLSGGTTRDSTTDQESAKAEGGDGFEGDVESIGEEDEPPDGPDNTSATVEDDEASPHRNGQASKIEH